MNNKRIIYAGTPEFAVTPLKSLIEAGYNVVAIYTQPDRKSGRGQKVSPTPVKAIALEYDIPVYQPLSLKNTDAQAEFDALNADLMIVTAYGLLLPKAILESPKLGCINIHASLLPRWRGAAPIQRALVAGDAKTGITLMQMDVGLDTGDMLAKNVTDIRDDDTAASLHDRLMHMGAELLIENIDNILSEKTAPEKQDDALATYAHKLSKTEASIDWSKHASVLAKEIAGFNPWPVAHTTLHSEPIRIWAANALENSSPEPVGTIIQCDKHGVLVSCGVGSLNIKILQMPGKKAMHTADFVNAYDLNGAVLGQ